MAETRFVETEALLAVLSERESDARRMMSEMNTHELREFADACDWLARVAWRIRSAKKARGEE